MSFEQDLIILDEPNQNLDLESEKSFFSSLSKMKNKTIVLTLHNLTYIKDFADYLVKEKNLQNENGITDAVREIIQEVKDSGNEALLKFINKHEGKKLKSIDEVLFNQDFLEDKFNSLSDKDRTMLIYMADRIEKFHNNDIRLSEELEDDTVEKYGYFLRPIDKVGLYAPGGKAQYPSSVLMTGVLAKLAGVNEITVMFPGKIDDLNLMFAASHLIGAKSVLNSGGAHTLAAVAFGTESIGRVDKVFGPGNRYVSEAKRQLYGEVGIDSLNGPSEVAIIVDENSASLDAKPIQVFKSSKKEKTAN